MPEKLSLLARFRWVGLSIVLGVSLAGVTFFGMLHNQHRSATIDHALGPYTDALAKHALANPNPEIWRLMATTHHLTILGEPVDGEPVAFSAMGEPLALDDPALKGNQIHSSRTAEDGTRITFYWATISIQDHQLPLLSGLLVMLTVVVGSAFWFLHRQLKPLSWLLTGVEAVTQGDFQYRAPVVRRDEIGQIAEAFNEMTDRVGEMIDDRERLLADVSHELRSPIARMRVALEFVPEGDKRDALTRDLKEMETLIAVLLEREELRSRTGLAKGESIDLSELTGEVVAAFADREPGVEFATDNICTIHADRELVRLLIQNLIDNAIKFSLPDSAPALVTLKGEAECVVLRITDDGIGFPADREAELFEPFVKLNRARGHAVGYGLGLNLCQRIVQLHDGTIRLVPRKPRGTEVVVAFKQ